MKTLFSPPRVATIVSVMGLLLVSACTRYYIPLQADINDIEKLQDVINTHAERYFILRQGPGAYSLTGIAVDTARKLLTGHLDQISTQHLTYVKSRPNHYGSSNQMVENEVHIYSADTIIYKYAQDISLPFQDIIKIEVIAFNSERTSTSQSMGTVSAILLGGLGLFVVGHAILISAFSQ